MARTNHLSPQSFDFFLICKMNNDNNLREVPVD